MKVEDRKGSDLNGPTGSGLVLAIKSGSDFMGNKISFILTFLLVIGKLPR